MDRTSVTTMPRMPIRTAMDMTTGMITITATITRSAPGMRMEPTRSVC